MDFSQASSSPMNLRFPSGPEAEDFKQEEAEAAENRS
jgi:hypothetical protein